MNKDRTKSTSLGTLDLPSTKLNQSYTVHGLVCGSKYCEVRPSSRFHDQVTSMGVPAWAAALVEATLVLLAVNFIVSYQYLHLSVHS